MSWQSVFKKYQTAELGKKGKFVNLDNEQVSQVSLFPHVSEIGNEHKVELDCQKSQNFLGEDWELYVGNENALNAWSHMLYERKLMEAGQAPPDFTAKAYCESCGQYVFLPEGLAKHSLVLGCPWCSNKSKGLHIPEPDKNIHCSDQLENNSYAI